MAIRRKKVLKQRRSPRVKLMSLAAGFWMVLLIILLGGEMAVACFMGLISGLPEIDELGNFKPFLVTEVYDHEGKTIDAIFYENQRRRIVTIDQVPKPVINAFLAAEDADFYAHQGIDFEGIVRAAIQNFKHKEIVQGASTITMQLVSLVLLDRTERTYERKAKEAVLAVKLETKMEKDKILESYLNLVYLGSGAHGVEEAARTYFGVSTRDLSLAQAAMIAGVVKGPTIYSPRVNLAAAQKRKKFVLDQMVKHKFIGREEADAAMAEPLTINHAWPPRYDIALYYMDEVEKELVGILGEEALKNGGYKVYTSLDQDLQAKAEAAVKKGVENLTGRNGWGVPSRRVERAEQKAFLEKINEYYSIYPPKEGDVVEALITSYDQDHDRLLAKVGGLEAQLPLAGTPWAGAGRRRNAPELPINYAIKTKLKTAGDPLELEVLLKPNLESALVSIDPFTREVKALVGGYDYALSQFNRATQSKRQPGSAMKPFVYSAAFSTREYTPATVIMDDDDPIGVEDGTNWQPKNYSEQYYGPTSLHHALVNSRNVVTAKLGHLVGIKNVIARAKLLGMDEDFPEVLSLSLGACEVRLLELVNAYAVFASLGTYDQPRFITHIVDRDGTIVYGEPTIPRRVLTTGEAYQMTFILERVVQEGTGGPARALGRKSAGKTGTTSDFKDAWYVGFTPQLVTGVWVGRDDNKPMPHGWTGGHTALPIWLAYMKGALQGVPATWYTAPDDVVLKYGSCFLKGTRMEFVIMDDYYYDEEEFMEDPEAMAKAGGLHDEKDQALMKDMEDIKKTLQQEGVYIYISPTGPPSEPSRHDYDDPSAEEDRPRRQERAAEDETEDRDARPTEPSDPELDTDANADENNDYDRDSSSRGPSRNRETRRARTDESDSPEEEYPSNPTPKHRKPRRIDTIILPH